MKKYIIRLAYIAALVGILPACSDEFLETEPSEFISANRVAEISEINPELQISNLQGIYANMYLTGTGGTDGHDDFGQKGYDIFSDMLSGDMVLSAKIYGWYAQISDLLVTVDFTNNRNYMVWRYYYRIIFGTNIVIDGLGGTDFMPEAEEAKHIMGQAKALRAYAYFYLANLMAESYNPSQEILPIYTNTVDPNQPLSTTQQVYDLIISDLTTAIDYLDGFNRSAKFAIDLDVAKALLAYVYSATGNNSGAATLAKEVIDAGNYSILPFDDLTVNGFNDVATASWMWGVDLTVDIGLDLISWWGQVDPFTYSYAWVGDGKVMNRDLFDAIPDDDGRKGWFIDRNGDGNPWAMNKFFDPGRRIGGQRTIETDYVYMRIEEMYLLHAENAAKSGDEAGARASLKALMEERVPDASYIDGLSGQALLDEIILQTRIELFAEGKSYLMMKRNELTITLGSNHLTYPGEAIPYNDDRLTFEIPQLEIQNNPFIN
jgi:hypothetical protein